MADQSSAKSQKPKPPGIISTIIFLGMKMILVSFAAWLILLFWFAGEWYFDGFSNTLQRAESLYVRTAQLITGRD
jgi:hypothetical protein